MKRLTYIAIAILATACHKEVLQPMPPTVATDTVPVFFSLDTSKLKINYDSLLNHLPVVPKHGNLIFELRHHK